MFSMYKNLILNNYKKTSDRIMKESNGKISYIKARDDFLRNYFPVIIRKCKLFQLPLLPLIPKPNEGDDCIYLPFNFCFIEGLSVVSSDCKDSIKLIDSKYDGYDYRGALIFKRNEKEVVKINIYTFMMYKEITELVPLSFFISTDMNGNLLKVKNEMLVREFEIFDMLQTDFENWVLSFLRFINLNNIKYEKEPLDKKTAKHLKRNKSMQTQYYVLSITKPSFTNIKRKEAVDEEVFTYKKRFHQVRGHLADYTQGNGLFGKYKMRVWVREHWKGDIRYGKIVKDYELKHGQSKQRT